MKKLIFILFFSFCSSSVSVDNSAADIPNDTVNTSPTTLTYTNEFGDFVIEDLTNKKTLIVFWADYWGICREELPLLEKNLKKLSETYDIIALAHSEVDPTMEWVQNNLTGKLTIGFSTSELRDELQVVGQPISIIFDTNGNILSREFGYIPTN